MRNFLFSLALSVVASGVTLHAQAATQPDNQPTPAALKATLLQRGDQFLTAWKAHDAPALTAMLAPNFTYVGPNGINPGVEPTVQGLMQCTVTSYHVSQSSLIEVSADAAILVTRQEQNVTCGGFPLPPVLLTTDTYIHRNGQWLLLLHTEAPPRPMAPQ